MPAVLYSCMFLFVAKTAGATAKPPRGSVSSYAASAKASLMARLVMTPFHQGILP